MKTNHSFELKYLALVLVTVAVTTAVWFGVRSMNMANAERQAEEQQALARAQSVGVPMGTAVEVTATEDGDEVPGTVNGWHGSMELTVTGATLYRSFEACKASDEELYNSVLGREPFRGAESAGISPSVLVVDLTVLNKDATTTATSGEVVYPSTYIGLGGFRLGIDNDPAQSLGWIDGSVDPESNDLWSYVSIEQGETKQVRLVFGLIPSDAYAELTSDAETDFRVGNWAATFESYVYDEDDALSLCLGWALNSGLKSEHVDEIPYVFELMPKEIG